MAGKSTRNKILYQSVQIDRYFDRIEDSMKVIDEYAQGRSKLIEASFPVLLESLEISRGLWEKIRGEL
jgi:hypothetical protein